MAILQNPKAKIPNIPKEKVSIKESLSKVVEFFSKNPFMKVILPIVIVISVVSVVFVIKESMSQNVVPASTATEALVYVLPMKERVIDGVQDAQNDPFASNITGSFVLSGIIFNPSGISLAMISSDLSFFVKTTGEEIGTTGWIVTEMTENTTKLEREGKTVLLELKQDNLANSNIKFDWCGGDEDEY